jgi:hypothetical protein
MPHVQGVEYRGGTVRGRSQSFGRSMTYSISHGGSDGVGSCSNAPKPKTFSARLIDFELAKLLRVRCRSDALAKAFPLSPRKKDVPGA